MGLLNILGNKVIGNNYNMMKVIFWFLNFFFFVVLTRSIDLYFLFLAKQEGFYPHSGYYLSEFFFVWS